MHPYSSIDTIAAWKKQRFILSVRSDFHMTDSLLIAVHAFVSHVLMPVSVDETASEVGELYLFQFKMGVVQFKMVIVHFKMEKLLQV